MLDKEIMQGIFEEYFEVQEALKQLEARKSDLRAQVQQYLEDSGEDVYADGGYKAQLVSVNANKFNKALFVAEHPELVDRYFTPDPRVQLRLTASKKAEAAPEKAFPPMPGEYVSE